MKEKILFVLKALIAMMVLSLIVIVVGLLATTLGKGWGTFFAVSAGIALGLGGVLLYFNAVDWANLRTIQKHALESNPQADQKVVSISGKLLAEGKPLVSPFSKTPCVAYTFDIASRGLPESGKATERQEVAEGYHLIPSYLQSTPGNVHLFGLPKMDNRFMQKKTGEWFDECKALVDTLVGVAPKTLQITRSAAKAEVYKQHGNEIHRDFCRVKGVSDKSEYAIEEEVLPHDAPVTLVGTFDSVNQTISGARGRFGPNLMAYPGDREQVIQNLKADMAKFGKPIKLLLGYAFAVSAYAVYLQMA